MKFLAAPAFLVTICIDLYGDPHRPRLLRCTRRLGRTSCGLDGRDYPDEIRAWIEANAGAEQISANGGT